MIEFQLNGENRSLDMDPSTPLLWVIRDALGLKGTKFGCGAGECGACTVHVDGKAVRSCIYPVELAAGSSITTIEGLGGEDAHPLQQAWVDHRVPQCGYCQPGMIMAAAVLITQKPVLSDDDIDEEMTNICRCGTYHRIRRAIKSAAQKMAKEKA